MQARSPDRSVILLSCPTDPETPAAAREAVCREMIQALSRASQSGSDIRRVPQGAEWPDRPGDIGIALHLDGGAFSGLAGHLEWRTPDADALRRGQDVRLDVLDSAPTPATYRLFVESLIKATPGMFAALHGDARPAEK